MSNKKLAAIVVGCTVVIIVAIVLFILEPWEVPASPMTEQLTAPANVLSEWESPPSPQGYPPILVGEVALAEYGKESSSSETNPFYLQAGQWIDVIVKSKDSGIMPLEYNPAGMVTFRVQFEHYEDRGSYRPDRDDIYLHEGLNPFVGRILYQQSTETGTGTEYAVAVRLFAEGEYIDGYWGGCDCTLQFHNFKPNESASISYEVYKRGVTPGWGQWNEESYAWTVLNPWIQQHASSVSEEEQMFRDWVEQFRLT